ncbi:DUF1652 domain-containing protein [Pseudomonas subflava]|uniref:DUF1652 domain-containing protein n=1 Tax=Pseudomonas subflava TaxID=2952933 RepID=UPI0020795251|nr:DUF1652 domain-containing protein [Pseudomonas subflava]
MGQSLNNLALSRRIEHAFLPLRCVCSVPDGRFLTLQLLAERSGEVEFTVVGIDTGDLHSEDRIARLVHDIGIEYELARIGYRMPLELRPSA